MPLANQKYSPGRPPPGRPANRSPVGGCWIEDTYYPFNWWLPFGTRSYYIAWIMNVDGIPFNYQPQNLPIPTTENGRIISPQRGSYLLSRRAGFLLRGAAAGLAGRTRVDVVDTHSVIPKIGFGGNLVDVPSAGPGYDASGPPQNRQWTAGISTVLVVNKPGEVFPGTYSYNPTCIEYPVGTSTLNRYRGLQQFVEETRAWLFQGLGSNPYRYFLDPISTIPAL